jgi:hypothetical protein
LTPQRNLRTARTIKTELKTAPLSIRIRPSLTAAIEKLPQENRRSMAEFVEIVLEDHANALRKQPQ